MAAPNTQKQAPKHKPQEQDEETLIRILGKDIRGSRNFLTGLTKIKGVSWGISNAACIKLKIPKDKKISALSKEEIEKVENFLKNPEIADYLKNRRKDVETGETKHFVSTDLDMKKDFDIRRLKKIRSYKGIRHTAKLPVRGQRTRSHFRKKGQAVKVKRK
jgi:small subunit ribosomal protein S13